MNASMHIRKYVAEIPRTRPKIAITWKYITALNKSQTFDETKKINLKLCIVTREKYDYTCVNKKIPRLYNTLRKFVYERNEK